jgi:hypothetical protein
MTNLPKCSVVGCDGSVSKAGFKLCLEHWRLENKNKSAVKPNKEQSNKTPEYISATELGELFDVSSQKINKIFSDLGWIKKTENGWEASEQGLKLKAQTKNGTGNKTYIKWPYGITKSGILKRALEEYVSLPSEQPQTTDLIDEFRGKFPGTIRTTDGHFVRSRAEALIDNWLYMQEIIHVYEKALPIEELLICDFFIPAGNVYIEFWGLENDPKYLKRKQRKLEIYEEHHFHLIELNDSHLNNLDDHLPKMLRRYGVVVD